MDVVDFATIAVIISGIAALFLTITVTAAAFAMFGDGDAPEGWREVTFATFAVAATGALLAIAILQVDGARAARDIFS